MVVQRRPHEEANKKKKKLVVVVVVVVVYTTMTSHRLLAILVHLVVVVHLIDLLVARFFGFLGQGCCSVGSVSAPLQTRTFRQFVEGFWRVCDLVQEEKHHLAREVQTSRRHDTTCQWVAS